jgi:hypothetical protein
MATSAEASGSGVDVDAEAEAEADVDVNVNVNVDADADADEDADVGAGADAGTEAGANTGTDAGADAGAEDEVAGPVEGGQQPVTHNIDANNTRPESSSPPSLARLVADGDAPGVVHANAPWAKCPFSQPTSPQSVCASIRLEDTVPELEASDLRWGLPALKVTRKDDGISPFDWLVAKRDNLGDQWKRFIVAFLAAQHSAFEWVRYSYHLWHSLFLHGALFEQTHAAAYFPVGSRPAELSDWMQHGRPITDRKLQPKFGDRMCKWLKNAMFADAPGDDDDDESSDDDVDPCTLPLEELLLVDSPYLRRFDNVSCACALKLSAICPALTCIAARGIFLLVVGMAFWGSSAVGREDLASKSQLAAWEELLLRLTHLFR